jgi:hypothetical protein
MRIEAVGKEVTIFNQNKTNDAVLSNKYEHSNLD